MTLIIGFSWIDGHLPVISNPGIGWSTAWRRWTLVIIGMLLCSVLILLVDRTTGCAASFVIMMLPPKSGRKAVRMRAAATIDALGHVYTSLMSAWITEGDAGKGDPFSLPKWVKDFRARLTAISFRVQAGKEQMMLASWEGGIRGRWPLEEYAKLTEVQEEMIAVLAQVGDMKQA